MNTQTFERVRALIADELMVTEGMIRPETLIADELGADSLDMVELSMRLEEEFQVSMPDDELEGIRSVADLVAMVERRQAEEGHQANASNTQSGGDA